MHYLFEKSDSLHVPMECFLYDCSRELFPIRPHWHYFAELIYVLRGQCEITCDEKTELVEEGEMILFPPTCVHSIFSSDGTLPLYAVLKVDLRVFSGEASPGLTDIVSYAKETGMSMHFDESLTRTMEAGSIFLNCIEEMKLQNFGYDVLLRAQIHRLLYGILRQWLAAGLTLSSLPAASRDFTIETITEYIDSRLEEELRISDLADLCHMSYSSFAAKFHARHGLSCKEYIDRMKVLRAEDYLLFSDRDLNYISHQLGFADCSHFIRCFKKYRGITPGQFRLRKMPKSAEPVAYRIPPSSP